jgi:hypothetical protein
LEDFGVFNLGLIKPRCKVTMCLRRDELRTLRCYLETDNDNAQSRRRFSFRLDPNRVNWCGIY